VPSKATSKNRASAKNRSGIVWPLIGINRTIILAIIVVAATLGVYAVNYSQAATQVLKSGVAGSYCLDDRGDGGAGTAIGVYTCNGSAAQSYSFSAGEIHLGGKGCLAVEGASATTGFTQTPLVLSTCSPVPWGAVWTSSGSTFTNNHASSKGTKMCMDVTGGKGAAGVETSVEIYRCTNGDNQDWSGQVYTTGGGTTGGGGSSGTTSSAGAAVRNVAGLFAGKEKETPDGCNCGGAKIDGANIDTFTQNSPEPWCADFASWVYWKAGYGLASRGSYRKTASVSGIDAWFQAHAQWYSNTAYNRDHHPPQAGDFLSFNVPADNSTHGGVIYTVTSSRITDIEGNYANGVNWVYYDDWQSNDITGNGNDAVGWGRL
jgi:hypothetical protein